MSYKPFKMKGSPIKRNFGIGNKVLSRGGSLFKFTEDDLKRKTVGPVASEIKIDRDKEEREHELKHKVEAKMDHVRGIFRDSYVKENMRKSKIPTIKDMEDPNERDKLYNVTETPRK